jgi:hypothetical protein
MGYLTKQEQAVLIMVVAILLTGWAVRAWRLAHPARIPVVPSQTQR